jgi:hypothetical protein
MVRAQELTGCNGFVCKEAWGFHGGPYSLQSLLGIVPRQKTNMSGLCNK